MSDTYSPQSDVVNNVGTFNRLFRKRIERTKHRERVVELLRSIRNWLLYFGFIFTVLLGLPLALIIKANVQHTWPAEQRVPVQPSKSSPSGAIDGPPTKPIAPAPRPVTGSERPIVGPPAPETRPVATPPNPDEPETKPVTPPKRGSEQQSLVRPGNPPVQPLTLWIPICLPRECFP